MSRRIPHHSPQRAMTRFALCAFPTHTQRHTHTHAYIHAQGTSYCAPPDCMQRKSIFNFIYSLQSRVAPNHVVPFSCRRRCRFIYNSFSIFFCARSSNFLLHRWHSCYLAPQLLFQHLPCTPFILLNLFILFFFSHSLSLSSALHAPLIAPPHLQFRQ